MNELASRTRTRVVIVGGGPAGLMVSHLLHLSGIDSVVLDTRTVHEIETTHRAGILEPGSVRLLSETGASERVLTEGDQHDGIHLRFGGESHHIDFEQLIGTSVHLYPQTDVFVDLHATRTRDGGDLRYGIRDVKVTDVLDAPRVTYTDDAGRHEITAEIVVGSDGSRSICRGLVEPREQFFREYPFAWFGFMAETPKNCAELIYTRSDRGFALISQRTESLQRIYFQCDPTTNPDDWSQEQIWAEVQARMDGPDGLRLHEGRILDPVILPFRSFVQSPMRHGRLLLAGDAAHTVPPTGAKGLNLALADARLLGEVLERALTKGDDAALDEYTPRALGRVWRAQHFSYWMTTMLHQSADGTRFDEQRQLGELETLVSSEAGRTYLAEGYTGWPTA